MKNEKTKIMIGIPYYDGIEPPVLTAVYAMAEVHDLAIVRMKARPHDYARNQLIRIFLGYPELSHLFFIDSDTTPPPDSLEKLVAMNAPVASGVYHIPTETGLKWAVLNRIDGNYKMLPEKQLPAAPFIADAAGAGCLLVRRNVLEEVPWPWFRWIERKDGTQLSEDVYFCKKLNRRNIRIAIDPSVRCIHHKKIGL